MATISNFDPGKPCWIDASVSTVEQRKGLISFYQSMFDWIFDLGGEEVGHYSIATSDGKPVLAISQQPGSNGDWVIYFATNDIATSVARASELGAQIIMPPMQVMDIGQMALLVDPAGVIHGLWQATTFKGFGVMYEPNAPGWFDHNSEKWREASDYYCKLLDLELMTPEPGGGILHRGDDWIASVSQQECSVIPAHWSPVIGVVSLDDARAKAVQLGAVVVVELQQVPGSIISVIQDPIVGKNLTLIQSGQA